MICQILLFALNYLTSAPPGPPPQPLHHEKPKFCISQTTAPTTPEPPAISHRNSSRLVDRTLQALRKTKLFVCNGTRTRSEVLPVRQSSRLFQTGNGLHSTGVQGTGRGAPLKLQISSRNVGRHLRNQSRAAVQTRGAVAASCHRLFARQRSPCLVSL